jgi:uncharacterized surface protein with fasciclin (FAS1) repeats
MRKLTTFFAMLALFVLALSVSGVAAQDATPEATAAPTNTLKDVLTNDGRFTTFLAAMESAGLDGILTGSTPFTIFAPTDDAFTAALGLLGMTSDDLMSADNHITLVKILGNHIVGGKHLYTQMSRGATLRSLAGNRITTSLVKVARTSRLVFLNGGASTISVDGGGTDLHADNGFVDVVDAVLLPDGVGLPTGYIRAAHFSPDAGTADILANGSAIASGVDFKAVGDWSEVTVGNYWVAVVPAGGAVADNVALSQFSVGAGSHTTFAAIGTSANSSIALAPITEDYSEAPSGKVHATFFHGVEGGPAANIVVDGATLTENLMYPGSNADGSNDGAFSALLNVGSKDIQAVDNATPSTVLASGTVDAAAGHNYLIAVVGTADAPEIVVSDTAPEAEGS